MIYSLKPAIQYKIWGGRKLARLKHISEPTGLPIGETWEISTHSEGPSTFSDGRVMEFSYEQLPYLAKFIDTAEELSVQVHPGDEYARLHEGSSGKSECWIILEADPGAGIYLGLKNGVTKNDFQEALNAKKAMNEFLNFYTVQPGDFYFVPAGSIHAIGGGITLAEIQQNSGITYRVWDWNRVDEKGKSRELHIQKSLDVINFGSDHNRPETFLMTRGLFHAGPVIDILDHESFKVTLYNLKPHETIEIRLGKNKRISSILNFSSKVKIGSLMVEPMSALLIENEAKLIVESLSQCSFLLIE